MRIWSKAERNIIDVSDVVRVVMYFLKTISHRNLLVNICNPSRVLVLDLVRKMEEIKGKQAQLEIIDGGGFYDVPLEETADVYSIIGLTFENDYIASVLQKYYANPPK